MGRYISLPCSQKPTVGLYRKPAQSSPPFT